MVSIKSKAWRVYAAALIAFLFLLYPNDRLDFSRYNAHDSEMYLALSNSLVSGFGYTRSMTENNYIPHTLFPPILPILLTPSILASGETINWLLVKYTLILIGLIGLFIIWKYLLNITSNKNVADVFTLFLAMNPFYWHFSRIAMAEVPSLIWIIGSLYLIHVIFSKEQFKYKTAFLIGALIGLGMMIKGILIGLLFAPLAYFCWRQSPTKKVSLNALASIITRKHLLVYLAYFLGFILAFSAWNVRNSQIDKTHLEFDGVNQVQMLFKEVVEDPNSDYKSFDKMVQTAKQNILWHGMYHLPNQIIPGIDLLKIKAMSMGNWLSVILCFIILLAITPFKRSSFALILVISPILIMVMMMPIGGSERYWGMISMLCILLIASNISLVISKTTSTKFKAAINTLALLAIIMQSISIINYVYQHEKNPYHSEGNASELAIFFELNRDFCFANGIRSDITVLTPHNAAFQLITGCSAPEVNENLGINPLFTHAIIRTELRSIKGRVVASHSPWSLVELNTPQYRKSLIK